MNINFLKDLDSVNEKWDMEHKKFFFSIKNIKTSSTLVSKNKQLYNK